MKTFLVALAVAVTLTAPLFAAEFTLNIKEASDVPLAGFVEMAYKPNQPVYVGPDSGIKAGNVLDVKLINPQGESAMCIKLDAAGTLLNQAFTSKLVGKRMVILINGKLISFAKVMAPSNEEFCTTGPTKDEIERIIESFKKR